MATVFGYGMRAVAADILAIVAVAALLVGIHIVVPAGVRVGLTLEYLAPNPVDALTAAYVHLDDAQLAENVLGYLAAAGVAYLLSLATGERGWFRLSWLVYLTVLPVVVGLTAAAVIDRPVVGQGFSGVVAGFVGFVLIGGGVVAHRVFGMDRRGMWEVVAALSMIVAAEILWLAADAGLLVVAGVFIAGVGLPLISLVSRGSRPGRLVSRVGWVHLLEAVVVMALILGIVTWFVGGLFPTRINEGSGVTNIMGHYLGIVYGGVIAALGYRYWSSGPSNRRS